MIVLRTLLTSCSYQNIPAEHPGPAQRERGAGRGERGEAFTTCKLKNLHSCLALTSPGTAACAAASPSWPTRSTWPAPPATGRATSRDRERTTQASAAHTNSLSPGLTIHYIL